MKEIKLTKNQISIVDDEDYEKLNQYKWHSVGINMYYAQRTVHNKGNKYNIKLHREIMNVTDSKIHIDHINGNSLDNRKENLRVCSNAENSRNSKIKNSNLYGLKGIRFNKINKNWNAQITVNYKQIHLGCFKTKEEAAIAYNDAAIKYHGEFAKVNKI